MENETNIPALDLQEQLAALKSIGMLHKLVCVGQFNGAQSRELALALQWLEQFQANVLAACRNHPDAHLVPGLVKIDDPETNAAPLASGLSD